MGTNLLLGVGGHKQGKESEDYYYRKEHGLVLVSLGQSDWRRDCSPHNYITLKGEVKLQETPGKRWRGQHPRLPQQQKKQFSRQCKSRTQKSGCSNGPQPQD